MTAPSVDPRAELNLTIARLEDEVDRAELSSHLGGEYYGRYRAKLGALIVARSRLLEMDR